jgi:hypothetical protein
VVFEKIVRISTIGTRVKGAEITRKSQAERTSKFRSPQ